MKHFPLNTKKSRLVSFSSGPVLKIGVGLIALMLLSSAHSGQDQAKVDLPVKQESAEGKPQSESPSLFKSIGNFFSGSASSKSKEGEEKSEASASASSSATSATSSPNAFSIIDIDTWSNVSNVVLDPMCKQPIQPFGITDNLTSLGILAAKLKNFTDSMTKNGQQPLAIKDIVKLAARNLNWLPMAFEKQIGESKVSQDDVLDENKNKEIRMAYAKSRAILEDILKNIPDNNPYDFSIKVVKTSFTNATALPGGIILVDMDLFKKGVSDEWQYFVIAHEVSHVLQRHQTRAYQAQLADGIDSIDNFRKLLSNFSGASPAAALSYASAFKNMLVNYSEQQELQADSCALQLMKVKTPSKKKMQEKLVKVEQRLGPIVPEIPDDSKDFVLLKHLKYLGDGVMERHPNTRRRKENFQVTINAIYI